MINLDTGVSEYQEIGTNENGNKYLNSLYPEVSRNLTKKIKAEDIQPADRARIREYEVVKRAIKDYTKGMIKWKNGQRIQ